MRAPSVAAPKERRRPGPTAPIRRANAPATTAPDTQTLVSDGHDLRYGDWQVRRDHGEPDRLLFDLRGSAGLSGKSDEQIVAEPKQGIA